MNKSTLLLVTLLTTFLGCLNSNLSFAQNYITFAPAPNSVDAIITNIFGVQCEGVSNVTVNGSTSAIGRYEYGQGIGLNSGLILSTGLINYSTMPSSSFLTSVVGTVGDSDIINYGNLNGSGASSYDAVSVEFDFTPQVSDTIRFRYIFASEEYPEYSNSAFNDRFMFLVSENGGTPFNIAQIPGTNVTVEINSINQSVNAQYYIDNYSGPASGYFVFDGYTVPLMASFYAQIGSTYHIKLVISDIADSAFDSAIFLDEQESYSDIEGLLTVNGMPAEGVVEVYQFVDDTAYATPILTIPVTAGTYLADSLETGLYHVRFIPDSALFPGAVPLYFATGSTWAAADAVALPCYLNNADIDADTLNLSDGNAVIAGNIVIDTTFLKSTNAPCEKALVKLIDQVTGSIVAFDFTDAQGNYSLTGIPDGVYSILVDVPYIPQTETHEVTIVNGISGEGFDFAVTLNGIIRNGDPILGIDSPEMIAFEMYPNPASDQVKITVSGSVAQELEIVTVDGQRVWHKTVNQGTTIVPLAQFASGVYMVRMDNGTPQRLVIQH